MSRVLCQICGSHSATYVCRECSKQVCEKCFNPHTWFCVDCQKKAATVIPTNSRSGFSMFPLGVWLFLAAFLMILVGVALLFLGSIGSSGVSVGFVFFLGPIPIVLGSGPETLPMLVIAAILSVVGLLSFVLLVRRR